MDYRTEHYHIGIGLDEFEKKIYQVINIDTEVPEYEDTLLSRCIETMQVLEDKLQEVMFEYEAKRAGGIDETAKDGIH